MMIPIVYAADNNYSRYMMLSMYSLALNGDPDHFYSFYMLVPQNFNEENEDMIETHLGRFKNVQLNFIKMDSTYDEIANPIERLSSATFYRLSLPSILEDADRCIYIDCDTIVDGDISELWNEDIGDNLLGGVKAHNLIRLEKMHRRRLKWDKSEEFIYVNCGVLLINLKEMRASGTKEDCMKLIDRNYYYSDQDILNVACRGRIKYLPCRYNVRPCYIGSTGKKLQGTEDGEQITEALKNPVIYHYAVTYKPWHNVKAEYAEIWLKYAITDEMAYLFPETKILMENEVIAKIISDAAAKDMQLYNLRNKMERLERENRNLKKKADKLSAENDELKKLAINRLIRHFHTH